MVIVPRRATTTSTHPPLRAHGIYTAHNATTTTNAPMARQSSTPIIPPRQPLLPLSVVPIHGGGLLLLQVAHLKHTLPGIRCKDALLALLVCPSKWVPSIALAWVTLEG